MDIIRQIRNMIYLTDMDKTDLNKICHEIKEIIGANCAVLDKSGGIIACSGVIVLDKKTLDEILAIRPFMSFEKISSQTARSIYCLPIMAGTACNGYVVFYDSDEDRLFEIIDMGVMDCVAVAFSIILAYSKRESKIERSRKTDIVKSALSSLSYSELEAIISVVAHLGGMEGLLVSSRIADEIGVTRSVIVTALKKLESAGVLESRSLGMKGTFIKILNEQFIDEMKNYRN